MQQSLTNTAQSNELDFDATYRIDGWNEGIAWRVEGWETKPDEDTWWSGYEVHTGMVLAHMVGDDRTHVIDPVDLIKLTDGSYCPECGQIGCTAYLLG